MDPDEMPLSFESLPDELRPYLASAGQDNGAGLAFIDRDGRFLFVSEGMAAINGRPAADHIGRRFEDLWPEAWAAVEERFTRVMRGEPVDFELGFDHPGEGRRDRTFHAYWSPVRVDAEVAGLVATVVDVTAVRESSVREQELAARQATLRAIANRALSDASIEDVFEDAADALQRHLDVPFVRVMRIAPGSDRLESFAERGWDPEIVRANPAGPRRGSFADYSLSRDSAIQFSDLASEDRFRRPEVFTAHGIRSGIGARVSSSERPWGQIGGYDRRQRVFDPDEVAFIEELAAILGLMVHERDARAFREEVLSMASHQMRTPLTSVIGLAQHLQRRIAQGRTDSAMELVESLVAEAFRLDDVLTQWNELAAAESYREAFASDPVDVGAAVAARVEQFRSRHPESTVHEQYPDPPVTIASDARRIGEIIDNLLENAGKYGGSEVEVSMELRPGGIALHCHDRGPGVAPEIAPYIFDRFFRGASSAPHAGMGLGLYISRKLAEGLGGTLDVTSAPGEGARFTLFLPAERGPRAHSQRDVQAP